MYRYLNVLKGLFVIRDIPAWNPSIRSASVMRSINKKGFVDPSIGAAALGLSSERLLDEPTAPGFFFEGAWIRDLTIYSTALGGTISYYRDR